jgi:hypothetical protein
MREGDLKAKIETRTTKKETEGIMWQKGGEEAFYQEYYSLFFNDFQYHSLFQTQYLAKLAELTGNNDNDNGRNQKEKVQETKKLVIDDAERKRASQIGYVFERQVDLSFKQGEEGEEGEGHHTQARFQFFSYDGILDESFATQMQMLLKHYDEESLMKLTLSSSLPVGKSLFPTHWQDQMNRQIFKDFLDFGDILGLSIDSEDNVKREMKETLTRHNGKRRTNESKKDKTKDSLMPRNVVEVEEVEDEESMMTTQRIACAFGSANTIDRDLVLKQLPAMKAFYALNPQVLDEVKKIVRDGLAFIGLDARQMHFLYKL